MCLSQNHFFIPRLRRFDPAGILINRMVSRLSSVKAVTWKL
jgi:hypothetical protein